MLQFKRIKINIMIQLIQNLNFSLILIKKKKKNCILFSTVLKLFKKAYALHKKISLSTL